MKYYVMAIFVLLICGCTNSKIDERLIGTWSETENSAKVIFTKDTVEMDGEKTQIYTESGRIISTKSGLPIGTYRFCTPEEFQNDAESFINVSVLISAAGLTEEEAVARLETQDDTSGRAYRYFRNMAESAGKGNVIELDGSGRYLQRR
jgi:hypothetical protein